VAVLRALALALPLILAAAGAAAKDEACTDGVDCLCDDIAALEADSGATVVFCEDFEAASLNDGDTSEGSDANGTIWGDGWATKYGAGSDACIDLSKPPGIGRRDDGMEGTHSWSCVNVVQEGACEVGTDCVMQGTSSLTHRYIPGNTNGISSNGISGSAWTVTRDFGITMAVKWSSNYSSPNENSVSGAKTNEFGDGLNCILGCSALNAGASTDDAPFANTVKRLSSNPGGSVATGACAYESEGYRCTASPGSYSMTKGEWMCLRVTYTNWGLAGGTFTYELDGEELIDVTGLNFSSHLDGDTDGIGSMRFNAYYNGVGPGDTGYAGGTQAYRGEDNIVVTNGAPVSCAAIGFSGGAPPVTPPLVPAAPTLAPGVNPPASGRSDGAPGSF